MARKILYVLALMLLPLLCYAANIIALKLWAYHFGYELLLLNGALTFFGLLALSGRQKAV